MVIKIVMRESLGRRSDVSSPEAKLGLWDEQKPHLSLNEKLKACFERIIHVSALPLSSGSQEIELNTSLAEAFETLSKLEVIIEPLIDVDTPEDASWIDRFIGIVEFPGTPVSLLHQLDPSSPRSASKADASAMNFLATVRELLDISASILSSVIACTKDHLEFRQVLLHSVCTRLTSYVAVHMPDLRRSPKLWVMDLVEDKRSLSLYGRAISMGVVMSCNLWCVEAFVL